MNQLAFAAYDPTFADLAPHIVEKFWHYHEANPRVWELLVRYARQVRDAGRRSYGVGAIFERIRWHLTIETRGDDFKLNNNYRSCYARLFEATFPEYEGFFETRRSPGSVPMGDE